MKVTDVTDSKRYMGVEELAALPVRKTLASEIVLKFFFLLSLFAYSIGTSAAENDFSDPKSVRIAGLQMEVSYDIEANKKTILEAIGKAAAAEADFLMTPEGSLSGYNNSFDRELLLSALDEVTRAARVAGIGLILGTCYKETTISREKSWNQIRVYSPTGDLLSAYSKILRGSPVDNPGTGRCLTMRKAS